MLFYKFELILSDLTHLKNLSLSYQIGQESIDCQIEKNLEKLILENPENMGDKIAQNLEKIRSQEYAIGCFGLIRKLTDQIRNKDRLEIYKSLVQDPKTRRREKAKILKSKSKFYNTLSNHIMPKHDN
jgi:putative ubiquitin-RnfH superfamily antitoxin RatB of RatAB toxin-antitoxin module